jgi:elongation factor G
MPNSRSKAGSRAIALVGPYGSGKTLLLESIAAITGAVTRKGSVSGGTSLGDFSAEARARQMSVELNVLSTQYLGEDFTFLDCPGSIEFLADTLHVLPAVDAAVVVCEPEPAKLQMLQPYLKALSDAKIPHYLFVNKIEHASGSLRELLAQLQEASETPLLLRQIPIWENGVATGFVDLALERAFVYRPHAASQVVDIADFAREKEARFQMLERLADYDEHLMEELLGDVEPPRDEVMDDLRREVSEGLVVPVLIGSAEGDHGIRRLLKALRHEAPDVAKAAERGGIKTDTTTIQIIKTFHGGHGRLSLGRVLSGSLKDGQVLHGPNGDTRVGGILSLTGEKQIKRSEARAGDMVALARLDNVQTGDRLSSDKAGARRVTAKLSAPVYRLAIAAADRKDEVKVTTQEMLLAGQGEIHLKVATEKLLSKYGLKLSTKPPRVPYRETIRKSTMVRGRHKRQSGGHGQFGDVVLEIAPLPRGTGFVFHDRIKGGVVPKQWIGSVEKGVQEYMKTGPLGFPVVDVAVSLTDGSYHSVDSSDAAFQTAGRVAMSEGLPGCSPVLLEPIMKVAIHVPNDATAKVNGVIGTRRGAPLGFDGRDGWRGWDTVRAEMPLSEVTDLIVDLRSLTQGVGTFEMEFDRFAELNGKLAEQVVATQRAA